MDEFQTFHNRLRMLLNIDRAELDAALQHQTSQEEWRAFRDNPHKTFVAMPTAAARKVWGLLREREDAQHESA